jgi:PAS domain S-box-containing protein
MKRQSSSDVTEERRSEERHRVLWDANPYPMWVFDIESLAFLAVNNAALEHYGYSRDEFLAMTVADIRPEADLEAMRGQMAAYERGEGDLDRTWRHRTKDGTLLEVETNARSLFFEGHNAHLVYVHDVTERLRAVAQSRRLEEELREAQKLEAVGRLAAGVAHDFNNLLLVIRGYAELLVRDLGDEPAAKACVAAIETAAGRATDLTHQLLAFSRLQVLELEAVDVNEIVREVMPMLKQLAGAQIAVVEELDPTLPAALADPSELHRVVLNLAMNAHDAMLLGGTLTVTTSVADRCQVVLTVSDTGQGMDEATRQRAFEPFFTTKPVEGTGLGLATVYGIVTQSDGHVSIESEPGKGTSVRVYLPLAGLPAEPGASPPPSPVPVAT